MSENRMFRIIDLKMIERQGESMIRFILVILTVVLFLVLFIPVMALEWVIGKFNMQAKSISSLRIIQGVFRLVLWISGVKVTEIGKENVPTDQSVLYVGNHRSCFDILLLYVRCHGLTGFVSKKEMEKWPLLRVWMRYLNCLFLDRENLKEGLKTILKAIDYVKSGISICIFPEGTRCKTEDELEMLPFHDGSFKIAQKSGCPIIPIALNNTSAMFEDQFPRIKPCHVVIEYGKPIMYSELAREDQRRIGSYTQNIILEMIKKNKELV